MCECACLCMCVYVCRCVHVLLNFWLMVTTFLPISHFPPFFLHLLLPPHHTPPLPSSSSRFEHVMDETGSGGDGAWKLHLLLSRMLEVLHRFPGCVVLLVNVDQPQNISLQVCYRIPSSLLLSSSSSLPLPLSSVSLIIDNLSSSHHFLFFYFSIHLSIYMFLHTLVAFHPIPTLHLSHFCLLTHPHTHTLPSYAYAFVYAYITEGLRIQTVLFPALLHSSPCYQSAYMGLAHASRGSSVPQQVRE